MLSFNLRADALAAILEAELVGDPSISVQHFQKIEDARAGDLSFLASSKFERFLQSTEASCIIVSLEQDVPEVTHRCYLRCEHPHKAFVKVIHHVQSLQSKPVTGVHPQAQVASSARIAPTAKVDAGAVVGEHCEIGEGAIIMQNVVLADHVHIGAKSVINPGAVIYHDCIIGERCILHANCVIGSDGFGYIENKDGSFDKIPQIGNVVLEAEVEIGACSCIDRAALGSTLIKQGVKIDNLVHIAHNTEIGTNSAIAALSGIAGGSIIGERNRLAGQVGIVGYVETVPDVIIGAQSGVSKNIKTPGVYSGSPAVELRQRLKQEAAIRRLAQ